MEEEALPQLVSLIQTLESPAPLDSFTEDLPQVNVLIYSSTETRQVTLTGLAPFHTIEDLQRVLWLQESKQAELFPKYTFLAIQDDDGSFQSVQGQFKQISEGVIGLPNPMDVCRQRQIQSDFVYPNGTKRPVGYFPRGRVTIEQALLPLFPEGPITLHCFPFRLLRNLFLSAVPGGQQTISQVHWYGIFYPYFPSFEDPQITGEMTSQDTNQAQRIQTFVEAKLQQIQILDTLLEQRASFRQVRTTNAKLLSFQWTMKKHDEIEGVDTVFFQAPVTEVRPYMRLLIPNATPITKLYKPDALKLPKVSDSALLGTWIKEPSPVSNESFLFAKVEVRKEEYGVPALYGTLRVGDDGTADFVLQPPRGIRSLDMRKDLFRLDKAIQNAIQDLPFLRLDEMKIGRANLAFEYQFSEKHSKKQFIKTLSERLAALNTLFQQISPPRDEPDQPLLSLRYKGVSNFVTEDRIASYLTYKFSRQTTDVTRLKTEISREFNITEEEALGHVTKYIQANGEYTTIDPDGKEFLALNNPGIDLAIYTKNINTYSVQLFNTRAITLEDIQRVTTALSCCFFLSEDDWNYALGMDVETSAERAQVVDQAANAVEEEELEEEDVALGRTGTALRPNVMALAEEYDELEEEEEVPAAAPAAQVRPRVAAEPVPGTTDKIVAFEWFINQLKKMDPNLFAWTPNKAVGENPYSKSCASNEDRPPVVFSQAQYESLRRIYAEDEANGRVGFILYGVPKTPDTPDAAKGKAEKFTVLRYGSDPMNLHYYLCAPIFCLRDRLPILESDWISTTDRDNKPKQKDSCPFCGGTKIADKRNPQPGETVYIRKNKPKATKSHKYIGFLKEGHRVSDKIVYELPCCFVREKHIPSNDPIFERIYKATKAPLTAAERLLQEQVEEDAEQEIQIQSALTQRVQQIVSFELLSYKLTGEYVLGTEKYPLESGKIGMPSITLDKYLGQDSSKQVARIAIRQELKPSAHGFFRLGVMGKTTKTQVSLFASLAPALNVNTATEVAQLFKYAITPRVFAALNFGNLVNEFFSPVDSAEEDPEIQTWASDYMGTFRPGTEPELKRLKRSYARFIQYIDDDTQQKQLRHFIHALAEPNLVFPAKGLNIGLTVIVIEYTGNPRDPATDIQVKCPMLGFDANRYANNAIVFLTTNGKGVWEPLVYVDTLSDKSVVHRHKEGYYQILQSDFTQPNFPKVVRERYLEFLTQCRSSYRGAFTAQRYVDSRALIPVSRVFDLIKPLEPTGFVRDAYNHLVAITVSSNPDSKKISGRHVLIPVSDDGNIFRNRDLPVFLGIQTVPWANANAVQRFYSSPQGLRLAELSELYQLDKFLKDQRIYGFRLGGPESSVKISLPIAKGKLDDESDIQAGQIETTGKKSWLFEYSINREIMFNVKGQGDLLETAFIFKQQQIDMIYQQLRLSFSNWIATQTRGGQMRQAVESLLDRRDLPNFEKMRRLEIEFSGTIAKMFYEDSEPYSMGTVLLRKDCIAIEDESKCGSTCKWVEGDTPRCKIHTPRILKLTDTNDEEDDENSEPTLNSNAPSAVRYFTLRLFDELLRIPARRHELFTQKIKRVQVPMTNIHIGKEWILPENVPAWYDLLLVGSLGTGKETPQFWEEFSREEESKEEQEELYESIRLRPLPEPLRSYLRPGVDKLVGLQVIGEKGDPNPVETILRYYGVQDAPGNPNELNDGMLKKLSTLVKQPVLQILMKRDPIFAQGASTFVIQKQLFSLRIVVPDYEEGPAILKMLGDQSDSIPSDIFPPNILQQSIKFGPRRAVVVLPQGPKPQVISINHSSNSNESEEENNIVVPVVQSSVKPKRPVRVLPPVEPSPPSEQQNEEEELEEEELEEEELENENKMPGLTNAKTGLPVLVDIENEGEGVD